MKKTTTPSSPPTLRKAPTGIRGLDEITNGGLPQFLWNVFYHWRVIADDCSFAYAAIGAQPQAEATTDVIRLLSAHESVCGEYIERVVATRVRAAT